MRYYDKNGNEIKAGMTIRMEDGSLELVYATEDSYGNPNLGNIWRSYCSFCMMRLPFQV